MSVIGTGVAAGVAQSGLQSQEVARRRDQRDQEATSQATRVNEMFESHLRALDEGDEDEPTDRLYLEGHLPEHPPSSQQQDQQPHPDEPDPDAVDLIHGEASGEALPSPPASGAGGDPDTDNPTETHHLDVRA